jgi:hypothetical protein
VAAVFEMARREKCDSIRGFCARKKISYLHIRNFKKRFLRNLEA